MRKPLCLILASLLGVLLLASCTETVIEYHLPEPNVYVVDSAWQVVASEYEDGALASRSLESEVSTYNAEHLDDQWRIYRDTVPAIGAAPDATLSMVDSASYSRLDVRTVSRADLAATRDAMRLLASERGALLYVDLEPPAYRFVLPSSPPAELPTDPYYLYAWYLIHINDGAIQKEEHDDLIEPPVYFELRIRMARQSIIPEYNAAHPDDPVALVYSQRYEMPEGVEARL